MAETLGIIVLAIVIMAFALHYITHEYRFEQGQLYPDGQPEHKPVRTASPASIFASDFEHTVLPFTKERRAR